MTECYIESATYYRNPSLSLTESNSFDGNPGGSEMEVDVNRSFNEEDLEEKLATLKKEKVEKNLLIKSIDFLKMRTFLSDHVMPTLQETNLSRWPKKIIRLKKQLQHKEDLNNSAHAICEENRNLEKDICERKLYLKDLIRKRSSCWNEAFKVYMLSLGKATDFGSLDNSTLNMSNYKLNEYQTVHEFRYRFKIWSMKAAEKSQRILQLSQTLHNLICFSGKAWANDKNLLRLVLCTGKILGNNFGAKNPNEKRKAFEELSHRLSYVNL